MGLSTYFIMALFSCDMDEDKGQEQASSPMQPHKHLRCDPTHGHHFGGCGGSV